MKSKNNLLIIFIIILFSWNLFGEKLELSINYLGLGVVKVDMEDKDNTLTVTAKSTALASLASKMNNSYSSVYTGNYLPDKYIKKIVQKDYSEDRLICYDRDNCTANRTSFVDSSRSCQYPIYPECRDFFSALYVIRNLLNTEEGTIWLDANKCIWKAKYIVIATENINSIIGMIRTKKVKVNFEKISSEEKERSDMLTNNLVDEDKTLYLWYSDDLNRIPLKAKFNTKPFAVTWNLLNYEK